MAARARDDAQSRAVSSVLIVPRQAPGTAGQARPHAGTGLLVVTASLAACEARIEREPRGIPTLAIVGASYTAGTGPDNPAQSWAVGLARLLRWNAVIYGVPGTGYVRTSPSGRGPMAHMLGQEALRGLGPALVIVQAGHDDIGVLPALE